VSPLGQKKRLKTFIDESARELASLYVSAGKRGLEIELSPENLASAVNGQFVDLKQV
jgi:Cys-tRNA(Pro)/Cys-tRNA(Cys) deacylase